MNFFKRLFSQRKSTKGPFFEFNKNVISDPELWSADVKQTVENLTKIEKANLYQICDILQESIERHCQYILGTNYTLVKLKENQQYLFKSYFELTTLNWILITNYFKKNNARDEVGQALWWTIKYSFVGHDNLFRTSSFKTFENAFQKKGDTYFKLLNLYFKPRVNEVEVYQNLFEIIIDKPLTDKTSEVDMLGSFLMNFEDQEKMPNSLAFNKHLSQGIGNFSKKLNQIKL